MKEERARQTGHIPSINVKADSIGEACHKALIGCYEQGCRVETPEYRGGTRLGFDTHATIEIRYPSKEPMLHKCGFMDTDIGLMQRTLGITHGIYNHWIKNPNDPNDTRWGYTSNERIANQIPFVLAKIKQDWQEKRRISERDYFLSTWRPRDNTNPQELPSLQNIQLRFIQDDGEEHYLNYLTMWGCRNVEMGWLESVCAQTGKHGLQILFARKISDMLGIPIKIGSYIDTSTSLHIYESSLKKGLDKSIERMRRDPASEFTMSLGDYLEDERLLKRMIAAQLDAEKRGFGKNIGEEDLVRLGYNLETFSYPSDWDTWPKEWDLDPRN